MKYLSDYTEKAYSDLFNKCGAFFAFGTDQFNEAKKEGVKYVNCGGGLVCDKNHVKELIAGLEKITKEAIKQDLADHGKERVILRELANHEAFYTGEIEDTAQALRDYPITEAEIINVYRKNYEKYAAF